MIVLKIFICVVVILLVFFFGVGLGIKKERDRFSNVIFEAKRKAMLKPEDKESKDKDKGVNE